MSQQNSEYGDDIKSHDNQIHGLTKLGQFSIVKDRLESISENERIEIINSIDHIGRTLLMHASVRNDEDTANWLLRNGADVAKKDVLGKNCAKFGGNPQTY